MRRSRFEFWALFVFLAFTVLALANGFSAQIFAQDQATDIWKEVEPIGVVLDEILDNYVKEPNLDEVVQGALVGMMNALDDHSSYISAELYREMTQDTEGEFEGIGVQIHLDATKNITVMQPIAGSPAAEAGVMAGDIIYKIDGASTKGMGLEDAAQRIKGPRGTTVHLTLIRRFEDTPEKEPEIIEVDIKRDKIPLLSITEARLLDGGIGYIRISDFKKTTASEIDARLKELSTQGMKSLILDLRYNPGGLLNASQEVCELFLPKNTLVTYTKGRQTARSIHNNDVRLITERPPVLPENFPVVLLVSGSTASSAEIVTGALQFWKRAIVVGEKTFGKGSVQTIIPLRRPENSALRLTTALYYTPAEVTIDKEGIKPDVEVPMTKEVQARLLMQMRDSIASDPEKLRDQQNHGSVTGNAGGPDVVEDVQLQKAVEILREDPVWENLVKKYHKDTHETQVAAVSEGAAAPAQGSATDGAKAAN